MPTDSMDAIQLGEADYTPVATTDKRCIPGSSDGGAHAKFFSGGHYSTEMISWLVRERGAGG